MRRRSKSTRNSRSLLVMVRGSGLCDCACCVVHVFRADDKRMHVPLALCAPHTLLEYVLLEAQHGAIVRDWSLCLHRHSAATATRAPLRLWQRLRPLLALFARQRVGKELSGASGGLLGCRGAAVDRRSAELGVARWITARSLLRRLHLLGLILGVQQAVSMLKIAGLQRQSKQLQQTVKAVKGQPRNLEPVIRCGQWQHNLESTCRARAADRHTLLSC